ncbi:hypothetical protein F4X90_22495 [Candidatus Poribacteria bacterium]|nr:hypothetical protein [Candidatus Poribacteria bacterium]
MIARFLPKRPLRHLFMRFYADGYIVNATQHRRLRYYALHYASHETPYSRVRLQAYSVWLRLGLVEVLRP